MNYCVNDQREFVWNRPVGVVVRDIATGAGGLGFDSRVSQVRHSRQSLTARHRCTIASELCGQALSGKMGPTTRYMLKRKTARIMKIYFV